MMKTYINSPYNIEKTIERIDQNISSDLKSVDNLMNFIQSKDEEISEEASDVTVICVNLNYKILDKSETKSLLKAYKTCHSEMMSLFSENPNYIDFVGFNGIYSGIFATSFCHQIDQIIETVGKINASLEFLRLYLEKKLHVKMDFQIGVDYEDAVVFKDGITVSDECTLNSRSWHGKVFQVAKDLATVEGIDGQHVYITSRIFNNLKDEYKKFFESYQSFYYTNIVNTKIINWAKNYIKSYGE